MDREPERATWADFAESFKIVTGGGAIWACWIIGFSLAGLILMDWLLPMPYHKESWIYTTLLSSTWRKIGSFFIGLVLIVLHLATRAQILYGDWRLAFYRRLDSTLNCGG